MILGTFAPYCLFLSFFIPGTKSVQPFHFSSPFMFILADSHLGVILFTQVSNLLSGSLLSHSPTLTFLTPAWLTQPFLLRTHNPVLKDDKQEVN